MAKILILEDETIVQLLMEEFVMRLGHEVVGPASTLEEAQSLADSCDAAILDINLGPSGEKSFPLAARLLESGTPFFFVTGYAPPSVDQFIDIPKLTKPVRLAKLREAIDTYLIR